jgi:polysaccharide biosynthesis/export protein
VGKVAEKIEMKLLTIICVLTLAFYFVERSFGEAAPQEQQSTTAVQQSAAHPTKPGEADGARSPALTGERRPLYRLCKSDVVEIGFTFSPELNQTLSVQPDGFITLRGAPQLYAEGLNVLELRDAIRQAYTGVLHDPEVTIVLREFDKPSFIAAGDVVRPGKYELRADTTLTEAIAIAGGFTPRAKHSQVVLFHHVSDDLVESRVVDVKGLLKSRALGEDVQLRPGDLLFVPQNLMSKIKQYMPASGLSLYLNPTQF